MFSIFYKLTAFLANELSGAVHSRDKVGSSAGQRGQETTSPPCPGSRQLELLRRFYYYYCFIVVLLLHGNAPLHLRRASPTRSFFFAKKRTDTGACPGHVSQNEVQSQITCRQQISAVTAARPQVLSGNDLCQT